MSDCDKNTTEPNDRTLLYALTHPEHWTSLQVPFRLKAWSAAAIAVVLPAPFGYWRPISLILWGLVGDPRSWLEALESILAGVALGGAYWLVILGLLTGCERAALRAMRAMAAKNRRTLESMEPNERDR